MKIVLLWFAIVKCRVCQGNGVEIMIKIQYLTSYLEALYIYKKASQKNVYEILTLFDFACMSYYFWQLVLQDRKR